MNVFDERGPKVENLHHTKKHANCKGTAFRFSVGIVGNAQDSHSGWRGADAVTMFNLFVEDRISAPRLSLRHELP